VRERGIEAFRAMIEGAVCGLLWRALDLSREAEGASLTRGAPARTRSGWSVARRLAAATGVGAGGRHQDRREALRVLDAESPHLLTVRVQDTCAGADENFTFESLKIDFVSYK